MCAHLLIWGPGWRGDHSRVRRDRQVNGRYRVYAESLGGPEQSASHDDKGPQSTGLSGLHNMLLQSCVRGLGKCVTCYTPVTPEHSRRIVPSASLVVLRWIRTVAE